MKRDEFPSPTPEELRAAMARGRKARAEAFGRMLRALAGRG